MSTLGVNNADMSARACTECGAAASDAADHCESCGAPLEVRKLHEGSDVRIEQERLDAALPIDPSLPAGSWGRVSDHPLPRVESTPVLQAAPQALEAEAVRLVPPRGVDPEPSAPMRVAGHAAAAPSPELSSLLASDISVAVGPSTTGPHGVPLEARATNTTGSHPVQPRRPPVLASEALQRDLAPPRPARRALRIWSPLLGTLGASAVWIMTHGQGMGLPLAGAFGGLALLGLPPMPYVGRAAAVVTVAATGLALVIWADASSPGGPPTIVLTFAVALLATGLHFRAWHRASMIARLIVSAGVLTGATFLWMSGDLADLTVFDTSWQSWLPRLVGLSFGILLMLSLLAFMDARSTGGAAVWAIFMVCWQAVHAAVDVLHSAWPKYMASPEFSRIPVNSLLASISTPLLTALFALGLAQLMAAGLAGTSRPRIESMRFGGTRPTRGFAPAEARVPPQAR